MKDQRMKTFSNYVGELTAIFKRTSLPSVKIQSSQDAYNFIYPFFDEIMDDHEEVKVIHLNQAGYVVNVHSLSSGSDNASIVEPKDIMRYAILIKTNAIILVHNHPSGNLMKSKADEVITRKLKNAGEFLNIPLLDSMIVTRESYTSFADEGFL